MESSETGSGRHAAGVAVTVVGSGTSVPDARRGQPCLLVRGPADALVLDLGSGSLQGVTAAGCDPRLVSALLVSHLHLDHVADLASWLFAFRNPGFGRTEPLVVGGGPGLGEHLERLRALWGDWVTPPCGVGTADLLEGPLETAEFRVEGFPVPHLAGSVGFRVTHRPSGVLVASSGDSGPDPVLAVIGRDADLYVLECSRAAPTAGHLAPVDALVAARESRCRRALLTHFHPGWDPREALDARRPGDPELLLAEDGMTLFLEGADGV